MAVVLVWSLCSLAAAGCDESPPARDDARRAPAGAADSTLAIPVAWLADSARSAPLPVAPPAVWVARVTPARPAPPDPPLPEAAPGVPEEAAPPPALQIDPSLKPPIPRGRATLAVPPGARRPAHVEMDVEVLADGRVGDVAWAGGSSDPALVEAATDCARAMTFYPALRGETPVVVWCRQRFDFTR